MIGLLVKALLFGFLALLVLPSLVPADDDQAVASVQSGQTQVEPASAAAGLFGGIAADLGGLCQRQPTICENGAALALATVERAQRGLAIAGDMFAPAQTEAVDPVDALATDGI